MEDDIRNESGSTCRLSRGYFFFSALTFAQRAFAAARILAIPAVEMRRLDRAVPDEFCAAALRCFAQRARCAAAILRRAAVDIERCWDFARPIPSTELNTAMALSNLSRSCLSSLMIACRFAMGEIVAPKYQVRRRSGAGLFRDTSSFSIPRFSSSRLYG
jgi:hypothetical protein